MKMAYVLCFYLGPRLKEFDSILS